MIAVDQDWGGHQGVRVRDNGDQEVWRKPMSDVTSEVSAKALDVPGSSTSASTQLIQWTPHGGANQKWVLTGTRTGLRRPQRP